MNKRLQFTNFGCRLNAYESEAMKELADQAKLSETCVVNTCAVTAEAVRKSRQEIRKLRRQYPKSQIVVTGCAAQIDPDSFAVMPEVNKVIGNREKMDAKTWRALKLKFLDEHEKVQVHDIMSVEETAGHLIDGFGTRSRAYVQVQNGCNHRCTFCIIPFGRGNSRSVGAGIIVDQIKRMVDRGYKEVVLTGVDLTSWGADLPGAPYLGNLVMRILKDVPDLPRLRISSVDSIEIDDCLMEAIAVEMRFMPHLHLSLQHGDDLILKRMKRRHSRDDAIRFCEEARKMRPEITFGADIIAGFPTETNQCFENSIKLVKECNLTWLHVFPYSRRQGTPAALMPQVNGKDIKLRAALLREIGKQQVEQHLQNQIGKQHSILMENSFMGRTEQFSKVLFEKAQEEGKVVVCKIKGHRSLHLIASNE